MKDIEKKNIPSGKEKGKRKPDSSFEHIKKALDNIKQKENKEGKDTEKVLHALEQELQHAEAHTPTGSQPPKPSRIQKKIFIYQEYVRTWMASHPERPPEIGEAALSIIETIATSDQDPNIIARSLGRIMKLILQI